jgi:hypothetical protein
MPFNHPFLRTLLPLLPLTLLLGVACDEADSPSSGSEGVGGKADEADTDGFGDTEPDARTSSIEACRAATEFVGPSGSAAAVSLSDGTPVFGPTTIMTTNRIGEPPQPRRDLRLQLYVEGVTEADPSRRVDACRGLSDEELAEALAPSIDQIFEDPRCTQGADCSQLEPLPVVSKRTSADLTFTGQRTGCQGNDLAFTIDMFDVDPFWSGPFACGSSFCLADVPVAPDTVTIPNQIATSTLFVLIADGLPSQMYDPSGRDPGSCLPAGNTRQGQQIEYVGPRDSNICETFREDYETCVN